ncbi:RNA polymerase sigma factor [Tengunoibacter tsumagoiensis]|uniref:RNA polymerase sigma factor n=1 Tax=Tengunoibacter tsumagoiensis TaxID=2014871 RepID=A0A402A2J8_9CHLR|nr:sigma-70 family RNA polymerase sigma factor [Tengunoibacter tsumagoiensis]GCE13378.1 hypothetical protein KTT_32370 [Tengunoibacter tsumagoiensis]
MLDDLTLVGLRPSLVRFCLKMIGDSALAEDIAQETLLEAWVHQHELRDQARLASWMFGIARNRCLMWLRQQKHHATSISQLTQGEAETALMSQMDLEQDLEAKEIAELLEHALDTLSPAMRELLIHRYYDEMSPGTIAIQAKISVAAASMRLQRAKAALYQILHENQKLDGYIMLSGKKGWQDTHLWCPHCGQHHLSVRSTVTELHFICFGCVPASLASTIHTTIPKALFGTAKGYKRLLSHLSDWLAGAWNGMREGLRYCPYCHSSVVWCSQPFSIPGQELQPGFSADCEQCRFSSYLSWEGIILAQAEVQRFWLRFPRMQIVLEQEREIAGQRAVVVTVRSIPTQARVECCLGLEQGKILEIIAR